MLFRSADATDGSMAIAKVISPVLDAFIFAMNFLFVCRTVISWYPKAGGTSSRTGTSKGSVGQTIALKGSIVKSVWAARYSNAAGEDVEYLFCDHFYVLTCCR